MGETMTQVRKSVPVLPWMRSPVDVSLLEECPLARLPVLDPSLIVSEVMKNTLDGLTYLFPPFNQIRRFKKLLQKTDSNSCAAYTLPSDLIESLEPVYMSALEKLKERMESEASRKQKF